MSPDSLFLRLSRNQLISSKYSGPAKYVVAKPFTYAEDETNISRNYRVLFVSTRQVETLNEPNFDHRSLCQNSTINLPIYSFGPETFFMSVYVLLYIENYIQTHRARDQFTFSRAIQNILFFTFAVLSSAQSTKSD